MFRLSYDNLYHQIKCFLLVKNEIIFNHNYFYYDADKMPRFKLKCMKLIRSETDVNDGARDDIGLIARMDNPSSSNPSPLIGPNIRRSALVTRDGTHRSIPSSLADSNCNEEDANQNNGTRLEYVEPINEAANLNAGNLRS